MMTKINCEYFCRYAECTHKDHRKFLGLFRGTCMEVYDDVNCADKKKLLKPIISPVGQIPAANELP